MVSLELAGTKFRENICAPFLQHRKQQMAYYPECSFISIRSNYKEVALGKTTWHETNNSVLCFNTFGCEAESKSQFPLPSICMNFLV